MLRTLLALLLLMLVSCLKKGKEDYVDLNYIVTNTPTPNSFDPLEADAYRNMPVMRMLYFTPIEISAKNTLISNVLEKFEYDSETRVISFEVKKGLSYSDQTPLTARDVALAIARMAYFRPTFPVIKDIEGVLTWSKRQEGLMTLPEGIRLDGQTIKIHFTKNHANPLFRFCLELFSIIPEKCLDLKSASLTCALPPASGYYEIAEESQEKIVFKKRLEKTAEEVTYTKIIFSYKKLSDFCTASIADNDIIISEEIPYHHLPCKEAFKANQLHWTPAASFITLLFNPSLGPFQEQESRQYFGQKVRELLKNRAPDLVIERSAFTNLIPGYLTEDSFGTIDEEAARKALAGKKITLYRSDESPNVVILDTIIEAAKALAMDVKVLTMVDSDRFQKFLNNEMNTLLIFSGFWAQDPIGDISMFYTPNLHSVLKHFWGDETHNRLIAELENETDPKKLRMKMEELNRHIDQKALSSNLVHFRRFYITAPTQKSLILPQAITSPAPWHLRLQK